ncbi:MAG: hypothetical protein O7C59_11760 [Rickettsia endosymbiont of Ixodes persulcatus]|nr:hypothetical protein [Rickettsia endosymbiont of Ixodes persulcatus]
MDPIKKIINIGNSGTIYQIAFCISVLTVKLKLVKSYYNLYSRKLEKKIKSRRLRIRGRRLSTNRILISRAELKHTNDKVIVTIYVYNRQKKYFFNKIISIAIIKNLLPHITKVKIIKKKSLNIKSRVEKQKKLA